MNPIRTLTRAGVAGSVTLGTFPLRRVAALLPGNGSGPHAIATISREHLSERPSVGIPSSVFGWPSLA